MTLSELLRRHRALLGEPESREASREAPERRWEPLPIPKSAEAFAGSRLETPETVLPETFLPDMPGERGASTQALSIPPEIMFPEPERIAARIVPDSEGEGRRVVWSARRLPQEMEEG